MLRIDGHPAWLVAIDGQPSEPFLTRDGRVALGPGSRIDVIVDAVRASGTMAPILAGDGDGVPVARLVYRTGDRPPRERSTSGAAAAAIQCVASAHRPADRAAG